jgi:hypothetical protein
MITIPQHPHTLKNRWILSRLAGKEPRVIGWDGNYAEVESVRQGKVFVDVNGKDGNYSKEECV